MTKPTATLLPWADRPAPSAGQPATSATADQRPVQWFGASHRITPSGEPDSRYGWLVTDEGPCIVKAMDSRLVAHNQTLLDHERQMFARLAELKAPVPGLVAVGGVDWLVTRFAGISLARAAHPAGMQGHPALSAEEQLSAWVHTLRALHPLANDGVLVIDLYDANIVLPLTEGTQGALRLHQPMLIDHAHTLAAGIDLRRPVWLNREMARIAPELRAALAHDQAALTSRLAASGASNPRYSRLPGEDDELGRRVWAAYDADQRLQQSLDSADIEPHQAMQYAAGVEISRIVQRHAMQGPGPLQAALQRMKTAEPGERFTTLHQAADAIAEAIGRVPRVSVCRLGMLRPEDLTMPAHATRALEPPSTHQQSESAPRPEQAPPPTELQPPATELAEAVAPSSTWLAWWLMLAGLAAFAGALASQLGLLGS